MVLSGSTDTANGDGLVFARNLQTGVVEQIPTTSITGENSVDNLTAEQSAQQEAMMEQQQEQDDRDRDINEAMESGIDLSGVSSYKPYENADRVILKDGRVGTVNYVDGVNYEVETDDGRVVSVRYNDIASLEDSTQGEDIIVDSDNSAAAEDSRIGSSMTSEEATDVFSRMNNNASVAPEIELTPENWADQFGENGFVETPIGRVKMGENQIAKLFEKGRAKEFGMVTPTLRDPDVIISERSESNNGDTERPSSYVFVKTFNRNGEKVKFYASITVKRDGMEVSISSHYVSKNKVLRALQDGDVIHIRKVLLPNSSEMRLAEHQNDESDLLPTQGSDTSYSKGSDNSAENNSSVENSSLDLPLDKQGEVDFDNLTPEQNFEWVKRNEGLDAAIDDLLADIQSLDKSIAKEEKKLSNLTSGKRTKQRMAIKALKERRASLERLLPPERPTTQSTTEPLNVDELVAEGARSQDDFDAALLHSEDVVGLADAYERERSLYDESVSSHWSQYMTAIKQDGFKRFSDPNLITGGIVKNWFSEDGADIDTLAAEISEMSGVDVTPQDIADFITENPSGLRRTSDKAIAFARRFSEVASVKTGKRIGYPTSKTGRAFLEAEREARELDAIAIEKFRIEEENYYFYQLLDIDGISDEYKYNPTDEELEYYGQITESQAAQGLNSENAAGSDGEVSTQTQDQRERDPELNEDDRRGADRGEQSQGGLLGSGASVAQAAAGEVEGLNSQNQNDNAGQESAAVERNNDEQREADSRGVADDSTREQARTLDRGNIRVLGEGLGTSYNAHSIDSERDRRTAESERLVKVAKENDLYISLADTKNYGRKNLKKTGESVVYINEEQNKVYKVKNPFAKAALKNGVQPEDVIYEHQVHNLLFPETAYALERISEEYGDVRLVLSQSYVQSEGQPSQVQIAEALAERGLYPEDNYTFGNEFVSVTDVEGDNVLLGEDGELYFIDPIIRFKKPVDEVIAGLTQDNNSPIMFRDGEAGFTPEEQAIIDKAGDKVFLAPNGEPSNLSPKQWAQVRTEAFKAWFGDWEKLARIERLRASEPVVVSNEDYQDKYELNRASAKNWLKDNVRGAYVNKDTNQRVEVSKVSIDKVTSHGEREEAHLKSLSAIPRLIESSIFIEERANAKGNGKYDTYQYYVVGINIDGVDYTAKIVFGVKGDVKYYDHNLIEIEKGALIDNLNVITKHVADNQSSLYKDKDSVLLSLLQTNASKVVDANGEPLVVYHGTDSEFTEFNLDTSVKKGYYFTASKDMADSFGGNVMELFLDIKNPIYMSNATFISNKTKAKGDGVIAGRTKIDTTDTTPAFVAFSPTQIKSATDNVGTFSAGNGDIRFRFIGEQGALNLDAAEEATTRLDNLSIAREMESAKKDAKVIKLATGWERGADEKWRYEVDDTFDKSIFDNIENNTKVMLILASIDEDVQSLKGVNDEFSDDVLDNWESIIRKIIETKGLSASTFKRMPKQLQDDVIRAAGNGTTYKDAADYKKRSMQGEFKLGSFLTEDLLSAYPELSDYSLVIDADSNNSFRGAFYSEEKKIKLNARKEDDIYDILSHELQHAIQAIEGFARGTNEDEQGSFYKYWVTAGEVEARNVQERMNMTYEERLNSLASETEDVAREDQIFIEESIVSAAESSVQVRSAEEFDAIQQEAVVSRGVVVSNLNRASVEVINASTHNFANFAEAKAWAKANIARTYNDAETGGKGEIRISNTTIDKFFSNSAIQKSDSKDVHQQVVKVLPGIIRTSIEAELHPDYKKVNGVRAIINGANEKVLIHRLYGAVNIEGKVYRVKVTLKEDNSQNITQSAYSYEATKIELLAGQSGDTEQSLTSPRYSNNSISATKLLNGVEKSYDKGKKLLDESENIDTEPTAQEVEADRQRKIERRFRDIAGEPQSEYDVDEVVERLSKSLNSEVIVIRDTNDITDLDPSRERRKRRSKGWYDTATGKVYVVAQNHDSSADVEATILHEVVGHKGMRALLGRRFPTFLDRVAEALGDDISGRTKKVRRVNAEEYIARIAEGDVTPGVFARVVAAVRNILRDTFGIDLKMSDGDIAYMLYLSKNNLSKVDNATDMVRIISTRDKVKNDLRFRTGADEKPSGVVFDSRWYSKDMWTLRLTDDAVPILRLQEAVEKRGGTIENATDVYKMQNHYSSRVMTQMKKSNEQFLVPISTSIRDILTEAKIPLTYDDVVDYVASKHGIERQDSGINVFSTEKNSTWAYDVATALVERIESNVDKETLSGLWKNIAALTSYNLDLRVQAGLLSKEDRSVIQGHNWKWNS